MCSTELNKRITFKRTRPNPLFQEWLEELHEEAQAKRSKLEPMLKEALDSICKYPLPLQSGAECAILKGFEKKLCIFLDKRLEVYNYNKSLIMEVGTDSKVESNGADCTSYSKTNGTLLEPTSVPIVSIHKMNSQEINAVVKNDNSEAYTSLKKSNVKQNNDSPQSTASREINSPEEVPVLVSVPKTANTENKQASKKSGGKTYKPSFRSGGYAILVGLLEHYRDNPNQPLSKEELIEKAQAHSEESFIRPKPDTFYTAWSNMSKLITKGLVQKSRHKKEIKYMLTDTGMVLANELLEESANIPTTNDIIFNDANVDIIRLQEGPSCSNSKEPVRQERPAVVNRKKNTVKSQEGSEIINGHVNRAEDCITNSPKEYIELEAGTFDIVLLIDKNETSGVTKTDPTVAQFNKYPALKHEYRSLKVGDFTWVAQDRQNKDIELVIPYVIERKRMDDLGHSIKDGRFHEQKFRLRRCGLKNVIYLVENFGKNKHVGLPIQSLMQALANTRVHDGFKVHITNSLSNTVRFLAMMSKRLTIEYKNKNLKGCDEEPHGETLMIFKYFNTSSMKSKPLTVTETFIKLILQLKGVSVEKALAITKAYSTPSLLIQKYKECDQKEGEFLLANLKYGELNRSVGPVVSKSLYQLFSNLF